MRIPIDRITNWLDNQRWKYSIIGFIVSFIGSFIFSFFMMLPKNPIVVTFIVWVGVVVAGGLIFAIERAIDEDVYKKRETMLRAREYNK